MHRHCFLLPLTLRMRNIYKRDNRYKFEYEGVIYHFLPLHGDTLIIVLCP
jgi:hypothetical protein